MSVCSLVLPIAKGWDHIFKYEGCPLLSLSCTAINRYLPESLVLAPGWVVRLRKQKDSIVPQPTLGYLPLLPIHIQPARCQ